MLHVTYRIILDNEFHRKLHTNYFVENYIRINSYVALGNSNWIQMTNINFVQYKHILRN